MCVLSDEDEDDETLTLATEQLPLQRPARRQRLVGGDSEGTSGLALAEPLEIAAAVVAYSESSLFSGEQDAFVGEIDVEMDEMGALRAVTLRDDTTVLVLGNLGAGSHASVYSLGAPYTGVAVKHAALLSQKDLKCVGQSDRGDTWRETHVHETIVTPLVKSGSCPHFPELHHWGIQGSVGGAGSRRTKGGRVLLFMEAATLNLKDWARLQPPPSPTHLTAVAFQLFHALAALQARDVVHFDIKLANIVMRRTSPQPHEPSGAFREYRSGGASYHVPDIGWQAMLCDFGLASVCDPLSKNAFYNYGMGESTLVARFGLNRSRRALNGTLIEDDGDLVAERNHNSDDVLFRKRGDSQMETVRWDSARAQVLAERTFANDCRYDTRDLALTFLGGDRRRLSLANVGCKHEDLGITLPQQLLDICEFVTDVEKGCGEKDAVHTLADEVLKRLFSDVFPPNQIGNPIAVHDCCVPIRHKIT